MEGGREGGRKGGREGGIEGGKKAGRDRDRHGESVCAHMYVNICYAHAYESHMLYILYIHTRADHNNLPQCFTLYLALYNT